MEKLSMADLKNKLSDQAVLVFQLITGSILFGATLFLGFIIFMYQTASPAGAPGPEEVEMMTLLSIIHGAVFIGGLLASRFIFDRLFSMARMESAMDDWRLARYSTAAEKYLAVMRSAMIVRMALLEAPAFFGLVICFMGATNGVLMAESVYWANLVSYAALVFLLLKEFPTRDRLLELFRQKLGSLLEY